MGGVLPLAAEFDQWGLLAPCAGDLALAHAALGDRELFRPSLPELRLVVPELLPALLQGREPGALQSFDRAIERLSAAGATVSAAILPELAEWRQPRMAIQMRQMLEAHRRAGWWPMARDRYTDEVRANLDFAEGQAATPLDGFRATLRALDAAVDVVLANGALLVLPTVAVTAPRAAGVERMTRGSGARHPIIALLGQAVLPFSRAELATITIPCGVSDGLPIGLQLVGTDDAAVLGAAAALEATLAGWLELTGALQ
jgi:aspartyl-tRNA(Asn)/glutamyl-tRNA(Gln) amidotransferase subunit A